MFLKCKIYHLCYARFRTQVFPLLTISKRLTVPYVWVVLTHAAFTCSKSIIEKKEMYEICSKLIIEIPERRHWRRSCVFMVNFEQISHIVLLFPLLTLNKYIPTGYFFTDFTLTAGFHLVPLRTPCQNVRLL